MDSSTFSLNQTRYPWAAFRQTKVGIKLHLKLCFIDKYHYYPEAFEITSVVEHDADHLAIFVDQSLATYVFDQGYIDYERLDEMEANGYFFRYSSQKEREDPYAWKLWDPRVGKCPLESEGRARHLDWLDVAFSLDHAALWEREISAFCDEPFWCDCARNRRDVQNALADRIIF